MDDKTIFELDPLGAQPADTDGFELERPGAPGTPYYVLYSQLKQTSAQILAGVGASFLTLTDLAATPADADYFFVWDSSAAALKRVLYTDLIPTQSVADLDPLGVAPAVGDLIEILDINDLTDGPDGTAKKLTVALLFTSPTFVTPALGTPASGILTNCTGLPNAAVIGLGSMALQAAGAVAITGGAITGTTIDGVSIKSYVDNLVTGLKWKQTVKVATTAAGTLASSFENGDTIDGVVLATGDRILIKNQAAGAENGIYVVAASGAPTRASDADTGTELVSATVMVEQGTVNAEQLFVCTNNLIALETTALVFVNFAVSLSGALLIANNLSDLNNAATARGNLGVAIGSDVQAFHANLAALAGLTGAADKGFYFTGAGALSLYDFSAFARTFLDDADGAAVMATLAGAAASGSGGLARLTNPVFVTPNLGTPSALVLTNATGLPAAGVTFAAGNRIIGATTIGAGVEMAFTTPAQQLCDDASFSAMRVTLGLEIGVNVQAFDANILTKTSSGIVTNKQYSPRTTTVASTATLTIDADATDMAIITAQAEALTIAAPTPVVNVVDGQKLLIRITDNGTARAISWNAKFRAVGPSSLPTTTVLGKTMYVLCTWNTDSTDFWDVLSVLIQP